MNDRPTNQELIDAVRLFLERELLPTLGDARLRFQTLVAANCLAIAARELSGEEQLLREEWTWLTEWLGATTPVPTSLPVLRSAVRGANQTLCERIRAGEFDEVARFQELARALRGQVMRKLEVANPKYLAGFSP